MYICLLEVIHVRALTVTLCDLFLPMLSDCVHAVRLPGSHWACIFKWTTQIHNKAGVHVKSVAINEPPQKAVSPGLGGFTSKHMHMSFAPRHRTAQNHHSILTILRNSGVISKQESDPIIIRWRFFVPFELSTLKVFVTCIFFAELTCKSRGMTKFTLALRPWERDRQMKSLIPFRKLSRLILLARKHYWRINLLPSQKIHCKVTYWQLRDQSSIVMLIKGAQSIRWYYGILMLQKFAL